MDFHRDFAAEAVDTVAISGASVAELAAAICRTGRPIVLTRDGVSELIVLPIREYEQVREAMEVAAGLLQGDADIAAGRVAVGCCSLNSVFPCGTACLDGNRHLARSLSGG